MLAAPPRGTDTQVTDSVPVSVSGEIEHVKVISDHIDQIVTNLPSTKKALGRVKMDLNAVVQKMKAENLFTDAEVTAGAS